MEATLYGVRISHPSRAALLMLRHKGIEPNVVEIPPGAQPIAMRVLGFRGDTVPGMKINGSRVQGTVRISRALENAVPEPPLFPADPDLRARVERAERWGDEIYQPVPRRIFRWAVSVNGKLREAVMGRAGIPMPAITTRLMFPLTEYYKRKEGGGKEVARRDVLALPGHLDHVDALIAEGVIGGAELNAADFQIALTTRVLLNFAELRPLVADRPAAEHAMRIAPDFGNQVPIGLPAEWVSASASSA